MEKKPFGAYHFTVEFDDEDVAYPFKSCGGLKIETSVVELEEGGTNTTTRKLIGRTKYPNIVLKRGLCSSNSELYAMKQWFVDDRPGTATSSNPGWQTPNRISGVITQLGPRGSYMKWRFVNGWVCKWEGPELDATKNEISIETIEIAHEGLMLVEKKDEQQ